MEKLPQIESISHMKHHYKQVLNRLDAGPIVLTQHGQAAAVLVSPTAWNAAVEEREELKDIIAALKAELALERGEDTLVDIDPDTFIGEITGDAVSA